MRADALGKQAKLDLIKQRLKNGEKNIFDPITRQNLLTMKHASKKVILTTSQGKLIQYQKQSNLAFTLLVKSQLLDEPLNLDEVMRYCLSPDPHCLGTPDGFFDKTNKATMMHNILDDRTEEVPYPKDTFFIQDGNALFHALTSLPPMFGDICLQILDHIVAKKNFIFSTDSYQADSIKAQERLRRGFGEKFLVEGSATQKPKDFKLFLANGMNNMQFCQLLLKVWGSSKAASRLEKCQTAALIVEGKAHQLVSSNGEVEVTEIHSEI
uniref:uncharacterized protein n=1 Tax=Myxine glutinosa TaxID=7769 RepID=UPI00358FE6F1